jgi:hypothetical protein
MINSLTYVTYFVLMPMRCIIATPNYIISLIAFKQQLKSESAFSYQIFISAAKVYENVQYLFYIGLRYHFAGLNSISPGFEWYKKSYTAMYIAIKVVNVVNSTAVGLGLFMTTAAALDRTFALAKPFIYKNINKKKMQIITLIICIPLSIIQTLDATLPRGTIVQGADGMYSNKQNVEFLNNIWLEILIDTRVVIRCIAVFLLIFGNVTSTAFYKIRADRFVKSNTQTTAAEQYKSNKRKKQQQTLLILTTLQSIFSIMYNAIMMLNTVGVYIMSDYGNCYSSLVLASGDMLVSIWDMIEFYVMLVVSDEFRKMVKGVLPFRCGGEVKNTKVSSVMTVKSNALATVN